MKREARLFLIRHGETVDNVAQVYAGSRDSALTNHGHQQATRLGQHFKTLGLSFTHIYSSHLQRAAKTAGLIRQAQTVPTTAHGPAISNPEVIQLPVLMEKDFGVYEGKKFHERWNERKSLENNEDSKGVESRESMSDRADIVLDEHLLPLFHGATKSNLCIAIVSHGMFLSALWKQFLLRLPPSSITLVPELAATPRNSLDVVGWSNTGFLELHMTQELSEPQPNTENTLDSTLGSPPVDDTDNALSKVETDPGTKLPSNSTAYIVDADATNVSVASTVAANQSNCMRFDQTWTTVIRAINAKDHLRGLKRTGGGVGSSRHDSSQQSIHSFFKRQKLE
ncbi:phosphoglycerate mutase-like protein [Periconia macrospinosa]|uniref:Phosphoglycerate mutase-like protein n=1 Tax=Periconia macrospinosa TaxID=97972 RepID=A0A2V1E5M0_9PLEO|nr:phosphoglycerate mutase-like protein [Periconia macrospinosa]